MKADPIELLLRDRFELKKFYFISGNEKTLMDKMKELVVKNHSLNQKVIIERTKGFKNLVEENTLFGEKKIHILSDVMDISNEILDKKLSDEDVYIFLIENSPKVKSIKNIFLNRKDSYLIDCYDLSKESKIKIVNNFLEKELVSLEKDVYWYLVERLDNKYGFLEKEMEKIGMLDKTNIKLETINKTISNSVTGIQNMFFELNKKNRDLVNIYKQKITNKDEVDEFFFHFKKLCFLVLENTNVNDFSKKIPPYMFREKNYLINIYKKITQKKRSYLLLILFDVEKSLRKESSLSLALGLRFLLKFKKLVTS